MASMTNELFLDTSVVIARVVHGPEMKQRIADQIAKHQGTVIGLIVRQEFKRRLLGEAQYLLRQLHEKKSYNKVLRHVVDHLGPWHTRKRNICLETLTLIHEDAAGKPIGEDELTERAQRTLRSFLRSALKDLTNNVGRHVSVVGCACAQHPVIEKTKYRRYDFGPTECSKTGSACGVVQFLANKNVQLHSILNHLSTLANKTKELENSERFIEDVLSDVSRAPKGEPCLKVGDLMIALESYGVDAFYTLNRKESLHLTRLLNQDLIIRPTNTNLEDEIFKSSESKTWPAA